ncbi:hypothetical protein [Kinneretia aquatilis]|uniref:hypothetical protein n=1 Tax=Kinneretia aquatilis TaxID=2070761 RepID=UPI0014950A3E|nr:hypothetical protein [Paucibacter aquatile]WIV98468.1 hypothetical protein K9V56_002865 [Paucibacter aquatile]
MQRFQTNVLPARQSMGQIGSLVLAKLCRPSQHASDAQPIAGLEVVESTWEEWEATCAASQEVTMRPAKT